MNTLTKISPMIIQVLSIVLGLSMISYPLLAPWLRGYFPHYPGDFSIHVVLGLLLFFLGLTLWCLKNLLWGRGSSPFYSLLSWFSGCPSRFYYWLQPKVPYSSWWTAQCWDMVQYLSSLKWPHSRLALGLLLVSLFPGLIFNVEFFLRGQLHWFYFSLLFLWIPLSRRFLCFYLEDYARWVQEIQEKDFTVHPEEGGRIRLVFHQENDPHRINKALNWNVFHKFRLRLDCFQSWLSYYSPLFLVLRFLFYSLGWMQILLSHPDLPSLPWF